MASIVAASFNDSSRAARIRATSSLAQSRARWSDVSIASCRIRMTFDFFAGPDELERLGLARESCK